MILFSSSLGYWLITLLLTLGFGVLSRIVPMAMDRAIKEIVSGIVQRSVSIATQTTKELVLKVRVSSLFVGSLLFKLHFSRLFVFEIVTSMSWFFISVDSIAICSTLTLRFNIL